MPSPISAKGGLGRLQGTGFDVPVLPEEDPRWQQLRLEPGQAADLRNQFRGALIGGAIGDAMGRPNEGVGPRAAWARQIRDYQPWHGWRRGPKGTITDDTQMTMWLAEAILAAGIRDRRAEGRDQQAANGEVGSGRLAAGRKGEYVRDSPAEGRGQRAEERGQQDREWRSQLRDRLIDPEDLAQRFTREPIRGLGQATREFVHNYRDLGKAWDEAGVASAGNGTAMRAAPVGLVHCGDPYRIYQDSLLQSILTQRDSMAIAAAACQAYATARAADPAAERSLTDGSIGGRSNRAAAWILLLDTPSGR